MTGARRWLAAAGLLSLSAGLAAQAPSGAVYRPALKPPEFLEPFAPKLEPGHDAFTAEPIAKAIEARLRQVVDAMPKGKAAYDADIGSLLPAGASSRSASVVVRAEPPRIASPSWRNRASIALALGSSTNASCPASTFGANGSRNSGAFSAGR